MLPRAKNNLVLLSGPLRRVVRLTVRVQLVLISCRNGLLITLRVVWFNRLRMPVSTRITCRPGLDKASSILRGRTVLGA